MHESACLSTAFCEGVEVGFLTDDGVDEGAVDVVSSVWCPEGLGEEGFEVGISCDLEE